MAQQLALGVDQAHRRLRLLLDMLDHELKKVLSGVHITEKLNMASRMSHLLQTTEPLKRLQKELQVKR